MLLAEDLMGATLQELIEDHGATFGLRETWYGNEWYLKIRGTEVHTFNADFNTADDFLSIIPSLDDDDIADWDAEFSIDFGLDDYNEDAE